MFWEVCKPSSLFAILSKGDTIFAIQLDNSFLKPFTSLINCFNSDYFLCSLAILLLLGESDNESSSTDSLLNSSFDSS